MQLQKVCCWWNGDSRLSSGDSNDLKLEQVVYASRDRPKWQFYLTSCLRPGKADCEDAHAHE